MIPIGTILYTQANTKRTCRYGGKYYYYLVQCPTSYRCIDTPRHQDGQCGVHIEGGDKVFMGGLECSQAPLCLDIKYSNGFIIGRGNDVLSRRMQQDGPYPIFVRRKDGHTGCGCHAPQPDRSISRARYEIIHGIGILRSMLLITVVGSMIFR